MSNSVIPFRRDKLRVVMHAKHRTIVSVGTLTEKGDSRDKNGQACDDLDQPRAGTETGDACMCAVLESDRWALEIGTKKHVHEVTLASPIDVLRSVRRFVPLLLPSKSGTNLDPSRLHLKPGSCCPGVTYMRGLSTAVMLFRPFCTTSMSSKTATRGFVA